MARIVTRSSVLAAPPERVFAAVTTPRVLQHIAAPLLRFRPTDPPHWPERFSAATYRTQLRLFGWLPVGTQVIDISFPNGPPDAVVVRDNGRSALIRRWDHWITITPTADGHSHYTDRVEIDAGLLTPLIAAFAAFFYAHRQRRLRALAETGFAGFVA